LSTGAPVTAAEVSVADECDGNVLWRGRTGAFGIARIAKDLGEPSGGGACRGFGPHPLMVLARLQGDSAFSLSNWNQGISPYDFGLPVSRLEQAALDHPILDRALFRAGETVSMKHVLRRHVAAGLAIPSAAEGHKIVVTHLASG